MYPVPPLPVPAAAEMTLDELSRNEAVRLFTARARAVATTFALEATNAEAVAAICRRLDGLPLALELAAARAGLLNAREILERLERHQTLFDVGVRDAPERQQTLAATIQWSYDLLDEDVRAAFPRLAVFSGGFVREAADRVCAVDLDVLGSLVEKSLVQTRDGIRERRFVLLETVRQFALGRLPADEEATVRRRLAEWLTDLAETAEPRVVARDDAALWLDLLEAEHDNIRAALGRTIETGATGLALRLAGSLRSFWEVRGHLAEGAGWLDQALALGAGDDLSARAKALATAGTLAFRRGDVARAHDASCSRRAPPGSAISVRTSVSPSSSATSATSRPSSDSTTRRSTSPPRRWPSSDESATSSVRRSPSTTSEASCSIAESPSLRAAG